MYIKYKNVYNIFNVNRLCGSIFLSSLQAIFNLGTEHWFQLCIRFSSTSNTGRLWSMFFLKNPII